MIGIRNHAHISPPNTTQAREITAHMIIFISFSSLWEFLYAKYPANEPIKRERNERIKKKGKTILSGIRYGRQTGRKNPFHTAFDYFVRFTFTLPIPDSM